MKLPTFNNRELLPLRLIPFVTGFKPAPHSLVRLLAHEQGLAFPLFRTEDQLFAYHLDSDGKPVKMIPKEWDTLAADMIILEKQFRIQETFEDEKYRAWRNEAIKLLPSGVFVWRDEFEKVFHASFIRNGRTYDKNAHGSTNDLNFKPYFESQYRLLIWEGFASLQFKQPAIDTRLTSENYQLTEYMRANIEVGFDDFVRLFQIKNTKKWVRGLRLKDNGVWKVPTLNGDFCPEELAFLNEHPAKNLRKPVLTFPCTLEQLDKFIKDQGLTGYVNPIELDRFFQKEIGKLHFTENMCSGKAVKSSKTGLRRNDLLSEEITAAIEELGGDCSPENVMKKLKEYAGKEGSCIVAVIPGGFTWLGRMRVKKDLDLEGLRKRLARRAAVKPPLGR